MMNSGKRLVKRLFCVLLVLCVISAPLAFTASAQTADVKVAKDAGYPFVFVPGFAGWGQYDKISRMVFYWGGLQGNLMKYLNRQGFECAAASVDPIGSAWDRACELYAQMTGTVVDYGAAHAAQYGHARFGTDYSKKPLLCGWGTQVNGGIKKVNFICHSFGGATARLLAELMANGDANEVNTSKGDLSPLFTGGKAEWVHSITALSSPHNGTTAIEMTVPFFKLIDLVGICDKDCPIPQGLLGITQRLLKMCKVMVKGMGPDTGMYDLSLDGAAQLNRRISTLDNVYYFSLPVDGTVASKVSNRRLPDIKIPELMLWPSEIFMGLYTGETAGGLLIDSSWFCNDGVVNTQSCTAPHNAASKVYQANQVVPGIWQVMETMHGVHYTPVNGGFAYIVPIKPLYIEHMKLINSL